MKFKRGVNFGKSMRTVCTVMRKRKGKNRSTGKKECIGNDGQEIQTPFVQFINDTWIQCPNWSIYVQDFKWFWKQAKEKDGVEIILIFFPLDIPGPPEGPLKPLNITKASCNLEWRVPRDDGGTDILHYCVEKMDMETGRWVPMGDVSGTYTRWVQSYTALAPQVGDSNSGQERFLSHPNYM